MSFETTWMVAIFVYVILQATTQKSKKEINYPNVLSAKRPILHGPGIPVPSPLETFGYKTSLDSEKRCTKFNS